MSISNAHFLENHFSAAKQSARCEDVLAVSEASVVLREFHWPYFPFNWHYHPELELTLIVRGSGLRFVGDSIEEFAEGDLCLIGANTPHSWATSPSPHSPVPGDARSLVVHFRADAWGEAFLHLAEMLPLVALFEKARRGLQVNGPARVEVTRLIEDMMMAPQGSVRRIATLLRALDCIADSDQCVELASRSYDPVTNHGAWSRVAKALQFIQENLEPDLTQGQVGAAVGLSSAALSQAFRRTMGRTYVDYVGELKVRKACRLLLATDLPITEVALASGFNNLSHFNEQFRRLKKMPPGHFRKQLSHGVTRDELPVPSDWQGVIR